VCRIKSAIEIKRDSMHAIMRAHLSSFRHFVSQFRVTLSPPRNLFWASSAFFRQVALFSFARLQLLLITSRTRDPDVTDALCLSIRCRHVSICEPLARLWRLHGRFLFGKQLWPNSPNRIHSDMFHPARGRKLIRPPCEILFTSETG